MPTLAMFMKIDFKFCKDLQLIFIGIVGLFLCRMPDYYNRYWAILDEYLRLTEGEDRGLYIAMPAISLWIAEFPVVYGLIFTLIAGSICLMVKNSGIYVVLTSLIAIALQYVIITLPIMVEF